MSSKNKNKTSQVIMKTDTTENWLKCEDKYIPALNTIIVYQDEGELPKMKVSDGIHKLSELQFINSVVKTHYQESPPPEVIEGDMLEFK